MFSHRDVLMQQYLCVKHKWDTTVFLNIHWDGIKSAMYTGTTKQQKAWCKLSHGLRATNKKLAQQNNRHDSRCHCCNRLWETWNHVFQCSEQQNRQHTHQQLQLLRSSFRSFQFSSPMITILIESIQS